jgi:hypothetical protein
MRNDVMIPDLPYQAAIVGNVTEVGAMLPPTWIEIIHEVQRWTH